MYILARYAEGPVTLLGRFPRGPHWPVVLADDLCVSINLEEAPLDTFEVAIKNYSECEGVLAELLRVHAVLPPHRHVQSGHVLIPVCRLTDAFVAR